MYQSIKKYISADIVRKYKIPLILTPIALLLIAVSGGSTQNKEIKTTQIDVEKYFHSIEKQLETGICQIQSVNACDVMITAASGEEYEYLENTERSFGVRGEEQENAETREYILVDNGSGKNVVIRSKKYPKVKGVLVIYEGASDINIKKAITDAVSTVLGVQSNKVCVLSNHE